MRQRESICLPAFLPSFQEFLCQAKNLFVRRRISHLGFLFRFFFRSQGWAGSLFAWGPTERAPHVLLDLPITFHPSAVFLSGHWPANIDHAGPEGGDGLVFLAPCFVPLLSQSRLHGNRCSLCVAFALGESMLPHLLCSLGSKGEVDSSQQLTGGLMVAWGAGQGLVF